MIGSSTTADEAASRQDEAQSEDSDLQVGEKIEANAARIVESIEKTGEKWASCTPAERVLAASACPKALYAELFEQVSKANLYGEEDYVEEFACKASSKKSKQISGSQQASTTRRFV